MINKEGSLNAYLFAGNSPSLAISSNIGALLGLTTIFGALVPGILGWGYQFVLATFLGIVGGYILFGATALRLGRRQPLKPSSTLLTLVSDNTRPVLRSAILAYYVLVITFELTLARLFLSKLLNIDESIAALLTAFMLLMCITYTAVGGFAGVLKTDAFQLLIFAMGSALIVRYISPGSVSLALDAGKELTDFQSGGIIALISSAAIVGGFHFGTPDLFVRTAYLSAGGRGARPYRVILWSSLGLTITALPPFLLGLILSSRGLGTPGEYQVGAIRLESMSLLHEVAQGDSGALLCWWLVGMGVCVLITTCDTYLVSVMQHLKRAHLRRIGAKIHLAPLATGTCTFLASFMLNYKTVFFAGFFATLVLFGNASILVMAAWGKLDVRDLDLRRCLLAYLVTGTVWTTLSFIGRDTDFERGMAALVGQLVLAMIFFGAYYAWKIVQKEMAHE